ncbi:hypothetical protein HRI_000108300 [Hibiscus trionum]|uniref:Uncharacterized protein n=1 Tax=Hibiscus trionum TaxID=183268 RepID=A0A9W7GUX2_HIBTR|nr:hypothetical protein HRI_000108300 [Hibiscus trionum]
MADNSSKNKTQCFPLLSEANQDLGLHSFDEKTVPLSGFSQGEKKEDSFGVQEFDAIEAAKKRLLKGKALDPQSAMESEKKPPFRAKDLDFPVGLPLKIEVIDDTALIGSFPLARTGNGGVKYQKKKKKGKHEIDEKKAKRSRKGKIARRVFGEAVRSMDSTEIAKKIMYSRKELEALRFANMEEQCNFWRDVYAGLAIDVTKEYEDLAHKNMARKATVPSTVGLVAGRGTRVGVNIFVH